MPSPCSATSIATKPSLSATRTSTRPPWGEYLTALSSRLTTTCRSRDASVWTTTSGGTSSERSIASGARTRGLDRALAELSQVALLPPERHRPTVDLGRDENLLDDLGEPVGLRLDHRQQLGVEVWVGRAVRAPQRAHRAVDGRQRRAQLVRSGREEVAARALELTLARDVLQHEHAPVGKARLPRDEPALGAVTAQRQNRAAALPGERLLDQRELGHDLRERAVERVGLRRPEVRAGGGIPVADRPLRVEQDDCVVDVLQRARRPRSPLRRLAELALDVVERPDAAGHREEQPEGDPGGGHARDEDDREQREERVPLARPRLGDDRPSGARRARRAPRRQGRSGGGRRGCGRGRPPRA